MPSDLGVIDLMIGFPSADPRRTYASLRVLAKDGRASGWSSRLSTCSKMYQTISRERTIRSRSPSARWTGMGSKSVSLVWVIRRLSRHSSEHPSRFVAGLEIDPNDVGGAVRSIRAAHAEHGIVAVTTFPAGCNPQVLVRDRLYYPIYQTCIDLDIPIVVSAGIAGPRVPSECQNVKHFNQVCFDFPGLRNFMRHGAEPWEDLAVKLMLK